MRLDDIQLDDGFSGGGNLQINLDPIGALPKKIISPTDAALSVANGFTLEQLDRAAKFEVAEGVPLGIYFGRNLFSLKLVSNKYDPITPEHTFTGLLGEGWGGLGQRGEWERAVKVWYAGQELINRFTLTEYFRDRLPAGAFANPDTDGWNWVTKDPIPFLGKYSHQSPNRTGQHQHFFSFATQGLPIASGDFICCWIYIDPINTPTEIMLQFAIDADFEHRAYWGANSIALGTNGTNSRRQISASIPSTGQWVRLDVDASQVGLVGTTINGMAFTLFGGAATWGPVLVAQNTTSGNSGYKFRPGTIAHNATDHVQNKDFAGAWPSGLAYNGSAGVTVNLRNDIVSNLATQAARPDAVKVLAECRRLPKYDATGSELIDQYGYSANPAWEAMDRALFFFQRRFRSRLDIAQDRFRRRFYWPSVVDWANNNDGQIPWDREGDGVNVFVPRFEYHGGLAGKTTLAQAFDELCGNSATGWQDDGEQIIFVPPKWPPVPVQHFHPGNIAKGGEPQRSTESLDARPNRIIGYFRDVEGEFHEPTSIEPRDDTAQALLREDSISRVGEVRSEHALGGMTQSQACRLTEYIARLEDDNPTKVALVGMADSLHVLPWDFVTVSHPVLGWTYQLCLVREAHVRPGEDSADECEFTLQAISGELYSDSAHKPRQEALTL
jgi:hypothetical protein